MVLRLETLKDFFEVETLIREAFWNVYQPGCDEHLVAHKLRNDASFVPSLDYVVEEAGVIIGSIFYAEGKLIDDKGNDIPGLLFGPVAVSPAHQHRGIGQHLIEFSMQKATELGYPFILITGNPAY